jgi:hypothetical protein
MLGAAMLGLNSSGWLKESIRSQREYLAESSRAAVQACVAELRVAQRSNTECCVPAVGW